MSKNSADKHPKAKDFYVPFHPQVLVQDRLVLVDTGMVKILRLLWRNGLETTYSCQGSEGHDIVHMGYIAFPKDRASQQLMQMLVTLDGEMPLQIETGINYDLYHEFVVRFRAKDRKKFYRALKDIYED